MKTKKAIEEEVTPHTRSLGYNSNTCTSDTSSLTSSSLDKIEVELSSLWGSEQEWILIFDKLLKHPNGKAEKGCKCDICQEGKPGPSNSRRKSENSSLITIPTKPTTVINVTAPLHTCEPLTSVVSSHQNITDCQIGSQGLNIPNPIIKPCSPWSAKLLSRTDERNESKAVEPIQPYEIRDLGHHCGKRNGMI